MSYCTVITAEVSEFDIKVEFTVNTREIGLLAGCEYPNEDGTNTNKTIVCYKDHAAIDFLREKAFARANLPQSSILGMVCSVAAMVNERAWENNHEFFKVTIQLQG